MKNIIKRLFVFLCIACMSIPLCSCGIKEKVDDYLDKVLGISPDDDKDSSSDGNEDKAEIIIEFEQKENIIF